jgi:hypothetical protein
MWPIWTLFLYLVISSILVLGTLVRRPRNWPIAMLIIALGAFLGLYPPIRFALHKPSSFDPIGDGFGIAIECIYVYLILGPPHLLFTFGLILDAMNRERRTN